MLLAWPLLGSLLAALLWSSTQSSVKRDWKATEERAFAEASSRSRAYAQQLERTVAQIDQLTLELKFDYQQTGSLPDLELRKRKGLHPEHLNLHVNIFDRRGNLLTASMEYELRQTVSDLAFFQAHQLDPERGLLISEPSPGNRQRKPFVRFSRSLQAPDGTFQGVVVVGTGPEVLTTFHDEALLGQGDFISVRLVNGPLLATKVGGAYKDPPIYYRRDPVFASPGGGLWELAEKFHDDRSRIITWKRLDGYPLVAISALSEDTVFAGHLKDARRQYKVATLGTAILLLFCLTGMTLSARLAMRRRQAEEVRSTYRIVTEAANEGFFILRPLYGSDRSITDFKYEDCNERGAALLGTTRNALIGQTVSELIPGSYGEEINALYRRAMETGFHEDEVRVSSRSPVRAAWVYRRVVRTGAGLTLTLRDISESKAHEQALSKLANTDPLTSLPNRHWLSSFLPSALQHAADANTRLAILFIDLDNFKNINDTLGHEAGDELLKEAAARLERSVRASDRVVRLGGDEFTIVLQQVAVVDDVARVARQVVREIREPYSLMGTTGHRVNASIGISLFPTDGKDGETLLKHADIAMYAAKAAGKGRYHFYQSHLSDTLILKLNKEQALRRAVERDEFVVHYQPRVNAATGKLSSMEALVRWDHPERGLVYPAEFIDIAEDNGLIIRLGELVIDKVCTQLAAWKQQCLATVPVSVNVSAAQLREGRVVSYLSACLAKHGIDPALLEVELTESSMIEKNQVVSTELADLRAMGVKLLIDDFGTGYSSLAQLHRLDVDILKVDRAFTTALGNGTEGESLFRAIVSMAGALEMSVVAEGVETGEQLRMLQALSCDEIQGHLVSRAMPAADMPALMRKRFLFISPAAPSPATTVA